MATARYEWITFGIGPHVIAAVHGTPGALAVTETATEAGSRPTAPEVGGGALFARVSAIDGNIIVASGEDPTAAQDNGVLVPSGMVEAIPIAPGEMLSFILLG